jgi:hypothetical protein
MYAARHRAAGEAPHHRDRPDRLLVLGLHSSRTRSTALRILALSLPLAVAYWIKNPGLVRYVAQLVPELALLAALGMGTLRRARLPVAVAAVVLIAASTFAVSAPPLGPDAFQELAPALERAPAGPLVTAAPDAYGVLIDDRPVRVMRPGAQGLILLDGAARAYEPGLRAEGTVVARIPVTTGFLRPDGAVDRAPALLYRGRVVSSASPQTTAEPAQAASRPRAVARRRAAS